MGNKKAPNILSSGLSTAWLKGPSYSCLNGYSASAGLSKFTGANPVTISTHLALLKLLPLWMQTADHPPRLTLTQSRITRQERPRYLPTGCKPDGLQQITRIWCAVLFKNRGLFRGVYDSPPTTSGCVHPFLCFAWTAISNLIKLCTAR